MQFPPDFSLVASLVCDIKIDVTARYYTGPQLCPYNAYTVMQSDGNSLCGDVVLDSYNRTSQDECNILGQK